MLMIINTLHLRKYPKNHCGRKRLCGRYAADLIEDVPPHVFSKMMISRRISFGPNLKLLLAQSK